MKRLINNNIYSSALITLILFFVFLVFCKPVINSDDNFYILYTLAGGYGDKPTSLLHYFYGWHPLLFWPVAKLFSLFPGFNWYTFLLLILQLISCICLLHLFFTMFRKAFAIILFIVFCLFFESAFLLSLNHSSTSFILAISGCSNLLFLFINKAKSSLFNLKKAIIPCLLILISGLLRVHTLALYTILTTCAGVILLPAYNYKKFVATLLITGFILFVFIEGQKFYYELKIPNFKEEEKFRQSLFYIPNHPTNDAVQDTGITKVKNSFIKSWFLYDTLFVNSTDIENFTKKRVYNRITQPKENLSIIYWTFINSRVYVLLFATIFITFIALKAYKSLAEWLLISLPGILGFIYLEIFLKVTEGIFIAILSSIFLSAAFCIRNEKVNRSALIVFSMLSLGLSSVWMIIRIKKKNDTNMYSILQTRSVLKELNAHQNYLFVNTGDFDDTGFYIWDTPLQFPAKNLINKELLITNSYYPILKRFKINNLMRSLPVSRNVFASGSDQPLFKDYYLLKEGLKVESVKSQGFKYLDVYQIVAISSH